MGRAEALGRGPEPGKTVGDDEVSVEDLASRRRSVLSRRSAALAEGPLASAGQTGARRGGGD